MQIETDDWKQSDLGGFYLSISGRLMFVSNYVDKKNSDHGHFIFFIVD